MSAREMLPASLVTLARGWVADCVWGDLDAEGIETLSPGAISAGVARHYDGGIAAFIADASIGGCTGAVPEDEPAQTCECESSLCAHGAERCTSRETRPAPIQYLAGSPLCAVCIAHYEDAGYGLGSTDRPAG